MFRFRRWWLGVLLAAVFLLAWISFSARPGEPVYQGRRLGAWLRGHPKDYHPVVRALGTNALPYLLAELQAMDSRLGRWGEGVLARVSMGPLWRTARDRRYHAGLGLQILDTNAVPALADLIFSQPMRIAEGDPGWSAASALKWLASTQAQSQVRVRLTGGLHSPDAAQRRNACLALSVWPQRGDDVAASLVTLSQDPNASVRAAAVRAIIFSGWQEDLFLPALVSRLADEQAAVRRLAIEGLSGQRTNAVAALPALRAAYANESAHSSSRDDLGDGFYGAHVWSAKEIRGAIRDAIKAIDPGAPLPSEPP